MKSSRTLSTTRLIEARKHFNRARALLRLLRGTLEKSYQIENTLFRDLGRRLSTTQDANALLAAFDRLLQSDDYRPSEEPAATVRFAEARKGLERHRDNRRRSEETFDDVVQETLNRVRIARARLTGGTPHKLHFDTLASGLEKTYGDGLEAMKEAHRDPNPETLRKWRKRVKDHLFHMQILRRIWPPLMKARVEKLERLAELLGDEHDLYILEETLRSSPRSFGSPGDVEDLLKKAQRRRVRLHSEARPLGNRLFAQSPEALTLKLKAIWARHQAVTL